MKAFVLLLLLFSSNLLLFEGLPVAFFLNSILIGDFWQWWNADCDRMGNFAADSIMVVVETLVGYSSWNCMDCWSTPSGHHLHSGLYICRTLLHLLLKAGRVFLNHKNSKN
jgi:hypothetical protein